MANIINRQQTFATNGTVDAASLHNLIDSALVNSAIIKNQDEITTIGTSDLLLIAPSSVDAALAPRKVTVQNLFDDGLTSGTFTSLNLSGALTYGTATGNSTVSTSATITNGTIQALTTGTTTSTNEVVTNGTITNLSATTSTFLGTITGSTNVINIGSGQIYKDASGNVGVGTTNPDSVLSVYANNKTTPAISARYSAAGFKAGLSVYNSLGFPYLSFNSNPVSGTDNATYDINGAASKIDFATGATTANIVFSNAASGTAGSTISWLERMRIDSSGNVGIGTTSPATQLQINSSVATYSDQLRIRNTNFGNADIGVGSGIMAIATDMANIAFYTSSNLGATGSSVPSNERLRIDSSGNVGIGIASPAYKFVVSNAGAQGFEVQTTSSSLIDLHSYNRTTSSYTDTKVNCGSFIVAIGTSSATERLRIDSFGNVGIGASTPVNKLEIVGSFGRGAPVTKTGDFTLADTENWLIVNKGSSCTVTLPAASSWTGREFTIKVITAHAVVSASSNIIPRIGGAAATAILPATDGAWATLVSNGTTWEIMCGS